jgi:hypothetical protein
MKTLHHENLILWKPYTMKTLYYENLIPWQDSKLGLRFLRWVKFPLFPHRSGLQYFFLSFHAYICRTIPLCTRSNKQRTLKFNGNALFARHERRLLCFVGCINLLGVDDMIFLKIFAKNIWWKLIIWLKMPRVYHCIVFQEN